LVDYGDWCGSGGAGVGGAIVVKVGGVLGCFVDGGSGGGMGWGAAWWAACDTVDFFPKGFDLARVEEV
jgi:hypothetical protein